jgi:signal transduction histidine kinase
MGGVLVPAATRRDTTAGGAIVQRPGSGAQLVVEERLEGTPYLLAFALPMDVVLARTRATVLRLAILSLLLTVAGALGSWVVGRRITRPLRSLTDAAEAIAQGDYSSRVEAPGRDEVARLTASFNRMATEIDASRGELREQVATARAMAGDLERANRQLQDANRQLEEARAEAERARVQAESANRAKSEFLAVMSHELRTPLNAIGGYTELMAMELRGPITDAQRRDLERIRTSQQHLLSLISSVLDLSRIESGRVPYQLGPIALDGFLAGLDALVAPQAAAKSLTLEYTPADQGLAVVADREKLRQILLNLLSNAIRYTPAGGVVTLAAEPRDDERVAIAVRDTGIGIPEDALEDVFEPFVQLDRSLTKVRDGVGLGLAISRDLARGMGGDLAVESRVGEGSCFTLTLPRGIADDESQSMPFTAEMPIVRRTARG